MIDRTVDKVNQHPRNSRGIIVYPFNISLPHAQSPIILTDDWLTQAFLTGEKIALIKAFRHVTGQNLIHSKLAIDGCSSAAGLIDLFRKYVQLTAEDKTQDLSNRVVTAIECVLKNWKELGFKNPYDACHRTIENLEANDE